MCNNVYFSSVLVIALLSCNFPGILCLSARIRTGKCLPSPSVNFTSRLYNSVSVFSSETVITVQRNLELKTKCFSPLVGDGLYRLVHWNGNRILVGVRVHARASPLCVKQNVK